MALGALAICWRDSSYRAYNMLGKRLPDFNNKSVIEIAHDAGYIHFLAHPCCQKWLTKQFFGNLEVKELDWGFCRLPYWFKVSSILVCNEIVFVRSKIQIKRILGMFEVKSCKKKCVWNIRYCNKILIGFAYRYIQL